MSKSKIPTAQEIIESRTSMGLEIEAIDLINYGKLIRKATLEEVLGYLEPVTNTDETKEEIINKLKNSPNLEIK